MDSHIRCVFAKCLIFDEFLTIFPWFSCKLSKSTYTPQWLKCWLFYIRALKKKKIVYTWVPNLHFLWFTYRVVVVKTSSWTSVHNSNLGTHQDNINQTVFLGTQASHQAETVSSSSALPLMKLLGWSVLGFLQWKKNCAIFMLQIKQFSVSKCVSHQ